MMKTQKIFFSLFLLLALFSACSDDDNNLTSDPFVVAFEQQSDNLMNIEGSQTVSLVYSEPAQSHGGYTVSFSAENAVYGVDFTTEPAAVDGKISLPIQSGTSGSSFVFNKLNANLDETSEIVFTILNIDYPDSEIRGFTTYKLNSQASAGGSIAPEVGGPNQPSQVYVDLSLKKFVKARRDSWDLAFFSKEGFRVGINGSIYMAAAELNETNIDNISEADVQDLLPQVAVGTFDPANVAYIDDPDGDINKTAINEISLNDAENKVYLVNLGYEVGTETPIPGSVAIAGDARGWRKIRILREGESYILQYAKLNDTGHQQVTISKTPGFNATFFSFNSNSVVSVEPEADQWDLNFTVFSNIIDGAGSYGFSDGVLHNRKGGVTAYSVTTDQIAYDNFTASNIIEANFQIDQRTIGASWRDVIDNDKKLIDTIFYIIKDSNNNIYKLKFTALLNQNGERGYPEFKYELLQ